MSIFVGTCSKSIESNAVENTDKQNSEDIPDLSDQAPPL